MYFSMPSSVEFAGVVWSDVLSVAIDVTTLEPVEVWGDGMPWAGFVDSVRRRVKVVIKERLSTRAIASIPVGELGDLVIIEKAGKEKVTVKGVVINVEHGLDQSREPTRTITLLGMSSDGVTSPIS